MNTTYKHWRPNTADFSQEPDRQRHKLFTSSHHKTSEIRAAGRDKEDTKHRSSRGHVSGGPPLSSSTPAPTYPAGAQSSATASKASHNAPAQPSQGHTAYISQKAPLPTATLPQESHSTAQRHWETAPDPRAPSHRTVTAVDRASLMSPDPIRHAEDNHKNSRHRPRHPSTPALESAEPQTAPTWHRPPSFLKKAIPEGREREKEQGRNRLKEESKATSKAKDKRRAERPQEQISRDQRERDRYEEERRHYKEERRREKERQRDEQRHDEMRHEQRVKDEYLNKSTRDQERRRETKDGHAPVTPLGKDPRLMRVIVKDSDESDNSFTKPPGSIRPRRQHTKDQTMTAVVPTVLRQPAYPSVPAQVPTAQAANNLAPNSAPNHSEPRQAATLVQPSHATPGAFNERTGSRPQRSSPPQNSTVPYPPGYAVSASDSEHVSRREHRQKIAESARLIERPRTSGGHRASIAHDAVSKPPVTQTVQPTHDKSFHRSEKPKGGFGAWLFHREPSNPHSKSADPHIADQNAAQPTGRVVLTPSTRNDIPESVPQVVSIRAGEGPADSLQEYGVRRAAPPAVAVASDAVARQPVSTVQAIQQPQVYDKPYRDAPRTVAGAQLDPPSHLATRVSSPQPWVQPTQWSTEPQPLSPVLPPPVVPSPVVFHTPLASPPPLVDNQQHLAPPRPAPHGHKESYSHTRDHSFQSPTVNGRPPAPPAHSHTVPVPATGSGQRASPQGASPMIHDVAGSKHARHSSVPVGYANAQPSYVTPPQSRPIAPGLAAAFPIREDNADTYRQLSQRERPQDPQPSRDAFDPWDRHRHNPDVARMVVSTVPSSSERTPRSTKASPSLHPRPVNQGTPPKPPLQPFDAPKFPPQSSTNPNATHLHDPSRPGLYNMPNQNPNSSAYPATSIYPSSSPRNQVEANSAINNLPVASASSNNPSPKTKSGNPSPRSRSQVVASSQGPTHPVAVHLTTRTPSHETGSTTLLGQTPSSQGSASMQLPMSPSAHPHAILPRVATHGVQQIVHAPAPVPDSLGDRNGNAINHAQVPTTRQTSSRHYHSNSAPVVSVPSLAQSPPVQSQSQPPARPAPLSPTPIRSYPTMQPMGDLHVARTPIPGYSTSVPNPRQQRVEIPSPSQESELNTPSSLAVSMKLPIVSDEPLAPVMSTQSYQEPKKKSGFFQGLGLFRSKSSAQKRHPNESQVLDSRAQKTTTTTTKLAASKSPTPLHYDSDSKVVITPVKLKKSKVVHTPVSAPAPKPPQPTPVAVPVPAPSFVAATEERFSSAPNAFASFRIVSSKRYRTMSGASADAVDGTNAGASTVLTSPANSTRSPTPKLIPPQRDPQQATHVWRNREEAEALQRGKARRRRPGVHFEGYEDHPQAERHRYKYAARARDKARG